MLDVFINPPRLDLQRLPDPDVVDAVCPAAAAAIRAAVAHQDRSVELRAVLESGRPGGVDWEAARAADRAAVLAGKPPAALGKLLAADPARYGAALAVCSTCRDARQRARQEAAAAGLEAACREALAGMYDDLRQRVSAALAIGRVTSVVLAAHEAVAEARPRLTALQDAARWAAGADLPSGPARLELPADLLPMVRDLDDVVAGVDPRQGWRKRAVEAMEVANMDADMDRRRRPYKAADFAAVAS